MNGKEVKPSVLSENLLQKKANQLLKIEKAQDDWKFAVKHKIVSDKTLTEQMETNKIKNKVIISEQPNKYFFMQSMKLDLRIIRKEA